ncbi:MAG: hypothetical protein D6733_01150 [Methanobacteriota archaeon]|nr:MAG: hypothetical protein D6733_01150 [Euryarchaeota archaeon]
MAVVDDVGSFPLPGWISREEFDRLYPVVREEISRGRRDSEGYRIFRGVILESFERKMESGVGVITYPQHYDMHRQFMEPIELYQKEPFLMEGQKAFLPEIEVIREGAKELYEKKGEKIRLKACVTGPVELYLRTDFGTNIYKDVLLNLAKSVNAFLKNSIVNTPYIETESLSIDEPSIGFTDLLNIEKEDIIDVLERAVKGLGPEVQIHLHTLKSADIALHAEGIDAITGEFAASPENMDLIRKKDLDAHDKFLRAGVTRTNIDSIIAEHLDMGVEPKPMELVDSKDAIAGRVRKLVSLFGDRISSWGPDCGLGSWPTQEVASEVLKRTAEVVRESFK